MTTFTTNRILTLRAKGFTIPEVAQITGVAEPGVRQCLNRAVRRKYRLKVGKAGAVASEHRSHAQRLIDEGHDPRVVEACFGPLG